MNLKKEKQQSSNVFTDASSSIMEWLLLPYTGNSNPAVELAKFSRSFEILEFQLGEIITTVPTTEAFYLLCQGQVRLVSFDDRKKREVSIQLLSQGESFGADGLFEAIILPYRAIAVNSVQVASISRENLQSWLNTLPDLDEPWRTAAQKRQRLIFLEP